MKQSQPKFPTTQLFILALVRVAEPIAITSIFPYAWKLCLDFQIGDKSNASFYAGILVSAFSFAESLTGMYWGSLSDRIGRKAVLLLGCAGTMFSLLIVGMSTNFWIALFGRCIGGALNGNAGVVQTMVGEITVNPKHEPRAYAVMPFVWSIGTIAGPAIGGYFANPSQSFSFISPNGPFGKFPYLLPNLMCAAIMLLSIIAGYFLLEETHPELISRGKQPHQTQDADTHEESPLVSTQVVQAGATTAAVDLRNESYGTFNDVVQAGEDWNVSSDGRSRPESTKVFTKRVVMLVVALGIFTYHSMTYDHLFPIFAETDRGQPGDVVTEALTEHLSGGLGLSIKQVGVIMSINGLIALGIQAVVFPLVVAWIGVWKVFMLVTILHPIVFVIVPFLVALPQDWLYTGIYTCLSIRNLFGILAYPTLLILLKEASPSPSSLGKINGLAASTGAACRTMASPIAGLLYGMGISINFTALAWWASAIVALAGTVQALFMHQRKEGEHHRVQGRGSCHLMPAEDTSRNVVHIHVADGEEARPLDV